MKMEFPVKTLFLFHQVADQNILFVFLWFLPFLTAQNIYDNINSQCLDSVSKCLSQDNWTGNNEDSFYLEQMKTLLQEHEIKLCHKLKAIYGNITEHMDEVCQSQSVANPDLNGVAGEIKTIKGKLEDLVALQEGTAYNLLLAKDELSECKESLATSRQAKNFTEGLEELKNEIKTVANGTGNTQNRANQMELNECQKNLANAQLNMEQLRECEKNMNNSQQDGAELIKCKKNVTDSQKEINELRHLINQRYTEVDVVNAARENDINKLRLLLDAGMKPDSRDPSYYRNTPLHVAAQNLQLEMIKLLVEKGAPLEARNVDSNTPLIDAAGRGDIPAVKLLIELGANPIVKGWHQETPRLRAIRGGHVELANWLKQRGW